MGKRMSKEERGVRIVGSALMLIGVAWFFLPHTRVWIVGLGVVGIVAAAVGVVLAKRKQNGATESEAGSLSSPALSKPSRQPVSSPPPAPPPPLNDLTRESVLCALQRLDWFQFEKIVAAIYRAYGDSVERFGGAHPDGGVDLIVTAKSGRFVVQCKHWRKGTVGVKNIRELLGTLTTSGIPKGVFVTMRGYSDEARDLGVKHGLVLLDQAQLAELIVGLGFTHGAEVLAMLNDPRKFCPKCESEMLLRTAKRGANAGRQFWGCPNYPRCDGTLEVEPV